MQLGRLKKVDPRTIWVTEDMDFTPWLAQEHNISLLSETLGLELEVEAQEKQVGPFRADILCKDIGSDSWVLIENQLECRSQALGTTFNLFCRIEGSHDHLDCITVQ